MPLFCDGGITDSPCSTELAQLPIGSLVASVGVEVHIVHGIEDDVIMAMSLVNVGSNHILVTTKLSFSFS